MMRKSFPQAVAFTKGTVAISVAPGNRSLNHGHEELAVQVQKRLRGL